MERVGSTVRVKGIGPFHVEGNGDSVGDMVGGFFCLKTRLREGNVKERVWGIRREIFFGETIGDFGRERKLEVPEGS